MTEFILAFFYWQKTQETVKKSKHMKMVQTNHQERI